MRVAAISVAPVFPNYVIGGSQRILADVAVGLKRHGHDVKIWCTGTDAHSGDFEIGGVTVHPDLKLRGVFPATHQVPPFALAETANALRTAAEWADRLYLHADAVYLRHALEGAEIVRSIHDFVYEEALLSTLTLPADSTIVPSEYLARCVESTVALAGRKTIEPVVTVLNGIQIPEQLPTPTLPPGIEARAENDLILLFPHRPELTKGVREAILTATVVQRMEPDRNVRLLMPAYLANTSLDDAAGTADDILRLAADLDASDIVELHGWLSPAEMLGYYASGDVTLSVGSFIESFGLVPVESVVNGTPAVCARVGALRQFDDVDGINLVSYGDIGAAAEAVLTAASYTVERLESGRKLIAQRYSHDAMITGYEVAITGTLRSARNISVPTDAILALSPWCEVQGTQIFDDYASNSREFPCLTKILIANGNRVTADVSYSNTLLESEIHNARELGILIPDFVFE